MMLGDDVMIVFASRTFVGCRLFVDVSLTREELSVAFGEIRDAAITLAFDCFVLVEFENAFEGDSVTLNGETGGVVVSMLLSVTFSVVKFREFKSSNVMISDVRLGPKCDALSEDSDPLGDGGNELPFELETPFGESDGEYDCVGDVAEYDSDSDRD